MIPRTNSASSTCEWGRNGRCAYLKRRTDTRNHNFIINNTGRHVSISLCKRIRKLSPITVVALERNPSGRRTIIRNDFASSSVKATQGGAAVVRSQGVPAQSIKRSQKGRIKSSTVAIYASIFVLLVAVIAVGYRAPEQALATTASVATTTEKNDQPAVNDVLATDIAASVAEAADLAVAPNVAELAVSTRIQSEYAGSSSDSSTISKPSIVEVSAAGRDITTYAVQEGDTVASVAAKYGLSENTIKWANNLTSNSLAAGSNLEILPRDGIVYVVKDGDTIEKIASRYKADVSVVTTYNDLEINGIATGLKIIIPNGELPSTERPGYVAPRVYTAATNYTTGYSSGFSGGKTWFIKRGTPMLSGNTYARGNCTAYAFDRRAELGRPVGARWGNATSWARSAAIAGYRVSNTPSVGAVIQNSGGYGHVAIVEAILPNGDLQLSEMNASVAGGGYNIVSGRILSAALVGQYAYIH